MIFVHALTKYTCRCIQGLVDTMCARKVILLSVHIFLLSEVCFGNAFHTFFTEELATLRKFILYPLFRLMCARGGGSGEGSRKVDLQTNVTKFPLESESIKVQRKVLELIL